MPAMRRLWRVASRSAGVLVALAVVTLGFTLTGVDHRPGGGQTYATETRTRLDALGAAPIGTLAGARADLVVAGELQVGMARVRLTPTLGAVADVPERGEFTSLPLAGYGDRQGRPATGVRDEVWVKAVAFAVAGRTGVVVAADALIVPREVTEAAVLRIRQEHGLERGQVYFGATHTHCSLGGWGEGMIAESFAGGFRPPVRTWMAQQLAAAVGAALADLGPAQAGQADFDAPDLTRNRLVGDRGTIDPQFSLLVLRQEDGDRAVLGSFSAHATVLSGRMMEFSGDYPGYWQRGVENQGGGLALFLAGGVGSHAPKAPAGGLDGAQRMGELLAARTVAALAGVTLTNRLEWSLATLAVQLPELQARLTDGLRLRPWVARRLLPVRSDTWLQALRVGSSVWVSTPCDYSGELARDLKEWAALEGWHLVVTSFNGDYVGYVVPEKYYHLDGYETRTMSFFGPQMPGYLDGLLRGLVARVTRPAG